MGVVVRSGNKGDPFVEAIACLGKARGSWGEALQLAFRRHGENSVPAAIIKGMIGAASTENSALAPEAKTESQEFLELSDRMGVGGLPFVDVPAQTRLFPPMSGVTAAFVGAGKPAVVSGVSLDAINIDIRKIAAIIPQTIELINAEGPAAISLLKRSLLRAATGIMDTKLLDPDSAGIAGIEPPSLTYDAPVVNVTGIDVGDIEAGIIAGIDRLTRLGGDPARMALAMSPQLAGFLHLKGGDGFANLGVGGGELAGLQVVTSSTPALHVEDAEEGDTFRIAVIDPGMVAIVKDGAEFSASQNASLEMKDVSLVQDATTGTGTVLVSAFQTNMVLLRLIRRVNWQAVQPAAVLIDGIILNIPAAES